MGLLFVSIRGRPIARACWGKTCLGITIGRALSSLLGVEGEKIDLNGLVSKLMEKGSLKSIVDSWLGDGDNEGISGSQILDILGNDKIAEFASTIGVDASEAQAGLADVLPKIIDKAISGGSLLDAAGGIGGLLDKAKKLF